MQRLLANSALQRGSFKVYSSQYRWVTGATLRNKRSEMGDIMDNNLLNMDDLADVFAKLDTIEEDETPLTEEELASQRRYEEIIKKHKNQA